MGFAIRAFFLYCLPAALISAACARQKIELEDPPENVQDPVAKNKRLPVLPAPAKSTKPEEESFTRIQLDDRTLEFHDLAIPPSFSWTGEEYRLFSVLHRAVLEWEQASYRSVEERDAAFFLHGTLQALRSADDVPQQHFRVLAEYVLPLYLQKQISSTRKPAISPEELERLVRELWDHGFNLNHVRREDLLAYTKSLQEILWKERTFAAEDPWNMLLAAFREESLPAGREETTLRRCLLTVRKNREGACDFGRYQLQWKPVQDGKIALLLKAYLDTGRGRDGFQAMLSAYQQRPGWFSPGMQFPAPEASDEFILAAAGPLPLALPPQEPPGNADWPHNLRQTDWDAVSAAWMDAAGVKNTALKSCAPGLLDALAGFLLYAKTIQGKPLSRVSSSLLAAGISDVDILARLWGMIWFLHATLNGHHPSLGIRSGCETQALPFLALRLSFLLAGEKESRPQDAETLSLKLLFGLLHHFRSTGKGEPGAEAKSLNPLSPDDFPELETPAKLVPSLEASWVLLSLPENFLLTTAPRILSAVEWKTAVRQIPFAVYRAYLPALPRPGEERISYRRTRDALDYYMQLTSEIRRLPLSR